jgi:hypothetical protein
MFEPFLIVQILLLVRHPLTSWSSGLLRAVIEFFLYFTTVNTLWSLAYYVSNGQLQAPIWIELLPSVLVLTLGLSERRLQRAVLERYGMFTLLTFSYVLAWLSNGFPTSAGFGRTQNYDNFTVNMIEIGYWAFSICSWLLSYFVINRNIQSHLRRFHRAITRRVYRKSL